MSKNSLLSLGLSSVHDGFQLVRRQRIPELSLEGFEFVHLRSRLKYFHLETADTSNVLCIGFCTPNGNSKGIPHILEHTTLCGSREFPVRDPFFHMLRRSLSSFMNAMTGMDYTLYPFQTVNPTDFQNLLRVYLDSTFHPLLRELDFTQEGHRLVYADKQLSVQGVVYNEMKGALAEPGRYFFSQLMQAALPGTPYAHVSGGDPLRIPDLRYSELTDFHKQHYAPSNATIITYGDMDARAHLKVIDEVIRGLPEGPAKVSIPELTKAELAARFNADKPHRLEVTGPADPVSTVDPSESTRVILSWVLPKESLRMSSPKASENDEMEIARASVYFEILSTLLTDGPASPMYKALIASGLGSDYCPGVGFTSEPKNPLFSFGLQGVNRKTVTAEKIESAILETIQKAIEEGFDVDRVRGIVHQAVLSKRHRSGKFGLHLTIGCVESAVQGFDIFEQLSTTAYYNEVLDGFSKDRTFFSDLMKSLFVAQSPKVCLTQHADPSHHDTLKQQEAARVEKLSKELSEAQKAEIAEQNAELDAFQKQQPNVDCLPTLQKSEISPNIIPELTGTIKNVGLNSFEVIQCPTNALIYSHMLVPLSIEEFSRRELLLLPSYASLLCDLGTNTHDTESLATATELLCSGYKSNIHISTDPEVSEIILGLHVSFHALPEKYADAMDLLTQILNEAKFSETDEKVINRVQTVLLSSAMHLTESVPSAGHQFALSSALCKVCPPMEVLNTLTGLEQVAFQNDIRQKCTANGESAKEETKLLIQNIIKEFAAIHAKILRFRMQLWSVCESDAKESCEKSMRAQIDAVSENFAISQKSVKRLSLVGSNPLWEATPGGLSAALLQTQPTQSFVHNTGEVAYLGAVLPTPLPMTHPDAPVLQLALRILSHELLHPEIREKGGAYGSGATSAPGGASTGLIGMFTYRDPTPLRSADIFRKAWAFFEKEGAVAERHIHEGLLSIFGSLDAPRTPKMHGCRWYLYKQRDSVRQAYRERLLNVPREELVRKVPEILKKYIPSFVLLGDEKLIAEEKDKWIKVRY